MPLFSLRTGGGLALLKNGEVVGGPSAQRKRLILLALVAAHGQGAGVARERVLGLLWPESDEARARNALNQLLFGLRRDLGGDVITGSNDLRLDSAAMDCDIAEVWAAQTRDDMRGVVANYHGPFLDGVYLSGAGDLNAWIDRTRTSVDDVYRAALARLARDADTEHSTAAAVALWRRLAAAAPLDAAVACSLMRALVANGDRTGALAHARVYGALIRSELEIEPDPSVIVLASEVAALSASSVAATSTPREVINTLPVPPDVRLRSDSSASVEIHLVGASGPKLFPPPRTFARRLIGSVGAVTLMAVGYCSLLPTLRRQGVPAMPSRPLVEVVFPFQIDVADSSLAFLAEGTADLLSAALAQQGGAIPADAHSLALAWKTETPEGGGRAAIAVRAMHRVGAPGAVVGTLVGDRALIHLSAQIVGHDGRIVGSLARASGPPDSILTIVDRLASSLLAGTATQDPVRLADLTTRSPTALREYLRALSAMRLGNRDSAVTYFRSALRSDTSFALAALGIALAGGYQEPSIAARMQHDFRLGWQLRLQLRPTERLLFNAAVGLYDPTEDSDAANLERWKKASAAAPDRADVLYEYGDRLFHTGAYLGIANADILADRAFSLAVKLDSSQIIALGHLAELALARRDTVSAQRYYRAFMALDTSAEVGSYLAWRMAIASGNSTVIRTQRGAFGHATSGALRRIAGTSQLEGISATDAADALRALTSRAMSERDRVLNIYRLHDFELNAGNAARSAHALDALADVTTGTSADETLLGDAEDLAITDAVFSLGDRERAQRAASRPEAEQSARRGAIALRHACSAELWRTEHNDTSHTAATLRALTAPRTSDDSSGFYGWQSTVCLNGLLAEMAVARHPNNARAAVVGFDSVMSLGPRGYGFSFGNLWAAHLFERIGEPARAITSASRRRRDWDDLQYLSDADALIVRVARATRTPVPARVATRLLAMRGVHASRLLAAH